jgi:poly(A) polymerase
MQEWPQLTGAHTAALCLNAAGFEAYIIGGAVRDMLLERTPKDFDLVTDATPDQVTSIPDFKRPRYIDTSQAYGVTRVRVPVSLETGDSQDVELEIATYRRDVAAHLGRTRTKVEFAHLEDDAGRRDFTVNALALDPATYQLIDIIDGLSDLEHRLLRFIGEPATRVQEDPLRVLRAIRLKNQLTFDYEEATYQALEQAIQREALDDIAPDRIRFELTYMLAHKRRLSALGDLDGLGALEMLLPEVTAQKGVRQPETIHAEGDVWQHCLLTMQYLPNIISPRLAWAALLHDVGKVTTARSAEDTGDRIRFDRHYEAGAEIARQVLRRIGFGKRFRNEVAWMVRHHLAIDDLPRMRPGRAKHMMSHPAFADLLQLHKADAHAAWSTDTSGAVDTGPADFSQLEQMWAQFQREQHQHPPSLKHDLGIDGNWLLQNFGLSRGPHIGEILTALEEKYLDDEIITAEDAQAAVRDYLRNGQGDNG